MTHDEENNQLTENDLYLDIHAWISWKGHKTVL